MEDVFKAAAQYAALGWRVLPIYGLQEDGKTCTCRLGADCGTPGKHPMEWAWQESATTDEEQVAEWFAGKDNINIGVALGEIIDVEWDDEQGKRTAEMYGVPDVDTPKYQSHRSEHHLFLPDPRLPQQAVVKINGLEVRIGGGSKGAQSVFPPSLHASGVRYRWKYGFGPDEVDVAPLPQKLLQALINQAGTVTIRESANKYLHQEIKTGERHSNMCRLIAGTLVRMLDPHDPMEQQNTLAIARSLNQTQCNPPLDDREVESIWRGELRWAIKVRATGGGPEFLRDKLEKHMDGEEDDTDVVEAASPNSPFTLTGLEYRGEEWWPGQWRLKVIHSDPVSYVLTIPAFGTGHEVRFCDIVLNAEQYRSAAKVAEAVLEATHTVILDEIPEEWAIIWGGRGARKGKTAIRGLKAKLMDVAVRQEAAAEAMRFAKVGEWFLGAITTVPAPRADDESGTPSSGGHPAWVRNEDDEWELWFGWQVVWEMADRGRRKILEGDQADLKRRILAITGEDDFPTGRHVGDGGVRRRYIRWREKHIRAVERLAAGDAPAISAMPSKIKAISPPVEGSESEVSETSLTNREF